MLLKKEVVCVFRTVLTYTMASPLCVLTQGLLQVVAIVANTIMTPRDVDGDKKEGAGSGAGGTGWHHTINRTIILAQVPIT